MDRKALLLYLQNIRDLEVARYRLQRQFRHEKSEFDRRKAATEQGDFELLPAEPAGLGSRFWRCVAGTLVFVILAIYCYYSGSDDIGWIMGIWFIPILVLGGIAAAIFVSHKKECDEYKQEYDRVRACNCKEQERIDRDKAALLRAEADWNARSEWYRQETQKLNDLLDSFYRMNLLPVQFRSLPAICYIYDYMSTSQETLTTALFDQHLENGIRRLEEKLDTVMSHLEALVYETRCIRRNSERTIAQNSQMLASLQRTEENTAEATQYAELSANYSKANAYFSLAAYLKQ